MPNKRWKNASLGLTVFSIASWVYWGTVAQSQQLPQQYTPSETPLTSQPSAQSLPVNPPSSIHIAQTTNHQEPAPLSEADQAQLHRLIHQAQQEGWSQLPQAQFIQHIATQFVGGRYRAGLLDSSDRETLVLSLQEFDCVLFIETVLALGKGILQAESVSAQESLPIKQAVVSTTFTTAVEDYRYRGGALGDYCDRLHYFSDWILDNQKRGNATAIDPLAIQPLNKAINFMGSHRSSYPQLKAEEQYQCIRDAENKLNHQISRIDNSSDLPMGYIPTDQIRHQYSNLQAGDIVAVATSIPGLDVTHTGLVYRHSNGNLGLIHAAPNVGVTVAADLQAYIERVDAAIGIIVTRPAL